MAHQTNQDVTGRQEEPLVHRPAAAARQASRRKFLIYGAYGALGLAAGGTAIYYATRRSGPALSAEVFQHDAPQGELWDQWQARGWFTEARHYLKLGRNVQCKMCPNQCLLEPEDRSHCRNRINKDGTLYTLAYGNPCALHVDPIEKKPLFHFLPATTAFSLATAGCVYRCLNCQNWDISQSKPEETKSLRGEPERLNPAALEALARFDPERVSVFPDDVVALAEHFRSPSIAYTYSEPIAWYEYMFDTASRAKAKNIKNLWITCGSIRDEALHELCGVIDAANVNLKSFDEEVYQNLNAGSLEPILNTLKTLKREGVWFEVTNLVVPTYTDDLEMIRRMCGWLVENLGPDYPLHFSRFHPDRHPPPGPGHREAGRAALRLHRQRPRCGRRRDHVLPGLPQGGHRADRLLCPRHAPGGRQMRLLRHANRRRLVGMIHGRSGLPAR